MSAEPLTTTLKLPIGALATRSVSVWFADRSCS
jgi:hypothetical protein